MKLQCGCEMYRKGEEFIIIPCSKNCKWLEYVLDKTIQLDHKVVYRERRPIS